MRSLIVVPLAGLMSFTLAAVIPQSPPVDVATRGLVYGHLDHPMPVEHVEMARDRTLRRPSARVLPNGDFYFAELEPGRYMVTRFMSGGVWYPIDMIRAAKDLAVDVEPGGIHFVGSWRVTADAAAPVTPDRFDLVPAAEPEADQLLRRLRPTLRGTGWEKQIKR